MGSLASGAWTGSCPGPDGEAEVVDAAVTDASWPASALRVERFRPKKGTLHGDGAL
ncbi:hypothetical protein GCM10027360_82710 [Amycolatopsis echigonensis]